MIIQNKRKLQAFNRSSDIESRDFITCKYGKENISKKFRMKNIEGKI